jgi:hypothetical protein
MSIGGQDILIEIPPDVSAADVIIRLMRQTWPGARFQDADRDDCNPIDSETVMVQGGRSREFFIFRDERSAEAWHRDGATSENAKSMLHFLVDDRPADPSSPRHVTLVCDEVSGAIESLVADLKDRFQGASRLHDLPARDVG